MKKTLCLCKCIHARLETVQTQTIFFTFKPTPQIKLPNKTCLKTKCVNCTNKEDCEIWAIMQRNILEHTSIYCTYYMKGVQKYKTECTAFSNATLDIQPHIPQYLEREPFTNDCPYCKGKGYGIVRNYLITKYNPPLYYREKCTNCNGEGIIRIKFPKLVKQS